MWPADLYEERGSLIYYKGLPTDTLQEHIGKCPACTNADSVRPGWLSPHGQIMKNPYTVLFKAIESTE